MKKGDRVHKIIQIMCCFVIDFELLSILFFSTNAGNFSLNDIGSKIVQKISGFVQFGIESTPGDIATCQTLDTAGEYTLTANIATTATCFNITADHVVLDGQGFIIDGDDSGATDWGINSTNAANDDYYDLKATLNYIRDGKASITLTSIHEKIEAAPEAAPIEAEVPEEKPTFNYLINTGIGSLKNFIEPETLRTIGKYIYSIVSVLIIAAIIVLVILTRQSVKKQKFKELIQSVKNRSW